MRLRLQKYIAQSGICSRRAAESLIREGKVLLNGTRIAQIGESIDPNIDTVSVDGELLRPKAKQYFIFHKPIKVLCSRKDPVGRSCFYELLPGSMRHLFYAGRLDYYSEGLMVLSNDGAFSNCLTHPRYGIEKRYRVRVRQLEHPESFVRRIVEEGIEDEGELLRAQAAEITHRDEQNIHLDLVLLEGKNREIRRMIHAVGAKVTRLVRYQVGPLKLDSMKPGKWRAFNQKELQFVEQLCS